jgi:hypothetical protein
MTTTMPLMTPELVRAGADAERQRYEDEFRALTPIDLDALNRCMTMARLDRAGRLRVCDT